MAGETIMALIKVNNRSSEDTAIHGRRNFIINGTGIVCQRNGSNTSINTYAMDRWRTFGGPGGFTLSPRSDSGEGDGYHIKFQRTSGNTQTNEMGLVQGIESYESKKLAGQEVTLSFRVRVGGDWSPTNFSAIVRTGTGNNENPIGMTGMLSSVTSGVISGLTTSFQTFTYTGTIPSNATQVSVSFQWTPVGTAGAADYVEIREVQLELGSIATPYENRSYADQLRDCQRYFEKSHDIGANPTHGFSGGSYEKWQPRGASGTNGSAFTIQFKERKMKSASVTTFNNTGSGSGYYHISGNADYTNGSIVGGDRKFTLTCPSTGNQNEYLFSWTADAEL